MVTCWADQFKKINVFCLANSTNAIEMRKMVESDLCDGIMTTTVIYDFF